MRLAILQSNYLPWKGYFDLMAMADLFVVYDSVQYTKNDWRNRNRIMSPSGPVWLTIPVSTAGRADQRIHEAVVSDPRWARKHWASIEQSFAKRAHFRSSSGPWQDCFDRAASMQSLHDINVMFLHTIAGQLAIDTPIVDDREFQLVDDSPTGKLIQLCALTGADRYVTGPAGLDYLEVDRFHEAGILLDVIEYDHYAEYPQTQREFEHGVSAIDLLASVGDEASGHLCGRFRTIESPPRPASDQL